MKDVLKKMLAAIAKSVQLQKEGKAEEATAELETAIDGVTDESIDALETPEVKEEKKEDEPDKTPEELEKAANKESLMKEFETMTADQLVSLKKRASICVDAQTVGDLLSQFESLKEKLTKENVEKLFEDVEKLTNTPVRKQDDEVGKKSELLKAMNPNS